MSNADLNRLMAERCMGWVVHHRNTAHYVDPNIEEYKVQSSVSDWHPTTDIAQAMMCVQKSDYWELRTSSNGFYCYVSYAVNLRSARAEADTPALAICKAIAAALGAKHE